MKENCESYLHYLDGRSGFKSTLKGKWWSLPKEFSMSKMFAKVMQFCLVMPWCTHSRFGIDTFVQFFRLILAIMTCKSKEKLKELQIVARLLYAKSMWCVWHCVAVV